MGGDLEGVTQMIESGYFTDLGVNALWISPFNTNPAGSYVAADGQHMVLDTTDIGLLSLDR